MLGTRPLARRDLTNETKASRSLAPSRATFDVPSIRRRSDASPSVTTYPRRNADDGPRGRTITGTRTSGGLGTGSTAGGPDSTYTRYKLISFSRERRCGRG